MNRLRKRPFLRHQSGIGLNTNFSIKIFRSFSLLSVLLPFSTSSFPGFQKASCDWGGETGTIHPGGTKIFPFCHGIGTLINLYSIIHVHHRSASNGRRAIILLRWWWWWSMMDDTTKFPAEHGSPPLFYIRNTYVGASPLQKVRIEFLALCLFVFSSRAENERNAKDRSELGGWSEHMGLRNS